MKFKDQPPSLWQRATDPVFATGFLAACYLAVLPMSGTIALRNLALLGLLLCLVWQMPKTYSSFRWRVPILLWVIYLCLFPVIADSPGTALENLIGQWGRGLLAMLVGSGVAAMFYNRQKGAAFYLGLASAFSILVHLTLFGWKAWATSSIPWGYWGREWHHADLGYAAGTAEILLAAGLVANRAVSKPVTAVLMGACLLSSALAQSRAGLVFGLIGIALVFCGAYLIQKTSRHLHKLLWLAGIVFVGSVVVMLVSRADDRWAAMTTSLSAGFYGDAIKIQCEGTASIEPLITARYGAGDAARDLISSVNRGDGARVVLMRAGAALALLNPWGSDGSRNAYQVLLKKQCPAPAILMAHAHSGWLDTMLALGWVGAALYLWVLLHFLVMGYLSLRHEEKLNEWALVLLALSAYWILRGFTDSVFRDHMLEMQGFILAYAASALALQNRSLEQLDAPQLTSQTPSTTS